jgi:hypothetical protein
MANSYNHCCPIYDLKLEFRTQINRLSAEECSELQKSEEERNGTKSCGEGLWTKNKNGEYQFEWLFRLFVKNGHKSINRLEVFCSLRWFSNNSAQYWIIENFCPVAGHTSTVLIETIIKLLILEKYPVCLWVNIDTTKAQEAVETVSKAFKFGRFGKNWDKCFFIVPKDQMSYLSHLNVEDQDDEKLVSMIFSYDDDAFIREKQTEMPLLTESEKQNIEDLFLPYLREKTKNVV